MLKKVTSYLLLTTFLLGISFTPTALSNETPPEKKVVLTTTTILADFTSRIGKDRLKVVSLIPPGVCPAHYDLKPSDIDAALKAKVIFYHGFEPWLEKLAKSIGAPEEKMVVLKGSWHPFSQAIELVEKIQEELFRIDPQNGSYYEKNADEIVQSIKKTAQEIKQEAQKLNISQYKVICMLWQKSFVEWIGLNIVGRFGKIGLFKSPTRSDYEKVREVMRLIGIQDLAKKPIGKLSGGQVQKVMIARALAKEPELLLLDEPFSNLDLNALSDISRKISYLHTIFNLTTLMVIHNVASIPPSCNRAILINQGRIVEDNLSGKRLNFSHLKMLYRVNL